MGRSDGLKNERCHNSNNEIITMRKLSCFVLMCCVFFACNDDKASKQSFEDTSNLPEIKQTQLNDIKLASGKLIRIDSFPSQHITPRPVDIWLPQDYSEDKKYSVLYMHDGQMLFDSTVTWNKQEWKVDEWATQLVANKKVKDFIVVAPHNISEIRHSDYFPQKPFEALPKKTQDSLFEVAKQNNYSLKTLNSDAYLKFLVNELKPFIDQNYAVHTDKNNTNVMGSSMGGLISMYAISEYPDVFGSAACLSTHWIGTYTNINNPIPNVFFDYMKANLPELKTNRIYFDYGTETLDEKYLIYQDEVSQIIADKGHELNLKFEGADHSENSWNKRLDQPLTFLLSN